MVLVGEKVGEFRPLTKAEERELHLAVVTGSAKRNGESERPFYIHHLLFQCTPPSLSQVIVTGWWELISKQVCVEGQC